MKKVFILLSLSVTSVFFAQEITKDLGRFNEVKIYDRISAELIPAERNYIEISGKRSSEVEVIQKNEELKVRMPITKLLKGEDISVKIYFTQVLEEIEAFEGSLVTSDHVIKANDLEITAKEGSQINLEIQAEELDVKVVTGAEIMLRGSVAGEMEAEIATGGVLDAKKLKTRRTEVSVSAGGEAEVFATDFVKARTKAGGTIHIYGKPAKIDQQTFAGGTITEK
ncbi:MAG: head GIN domain-containing protein [Flavobacteriaceae bacterium]